MKSKYKNRLLCLENDLRVGLSTTIQRTDKSYGTHQAQASHQYKASVNLTTTTKPIIAITIIIILVY